MSTLCPHCNQPIPILESLSETANTELIELMSRHLTMLSIEKLCKHTQLTFEQARAYLECPHGVPRNKPSVSVNKTSTKGQEPPLCSLCKMALPKIENIEWSALRNVALLIRKKEKISAIKEIKQLTHWSLRDSKQYVDCPHQLPQNSKEDQ